MTDLQVQRVRFPPEQRAAYRNEKAFCSLVSPRKIAREYGIKDTNPY